MIFSMLKVEKAVRPPQRPVLRKRDMFLLRRTELKKPIMNAPTRFAISVENGNALFKGSSVIRYLTMAPTAPPQATDTMLIIIFIFNYRFTRFFHIVKKNFHFFKIILLKKVAFILVSVALFDTGVYYNKNRG